MSGPPPSPSRKLRTLDDVPVDGRKVLVRVDFNVSVGADRRVDQFEDYRLEAALPTINELRQRRSRVILLTHFGRPQEESGEFDMSPIHFRLEELLGEEIKTTKKLFGNEVETIISSLEPGGVVLLPNVRSDEREEMGNDKFAQELASTADVYVNEAFSVCHRAHTSVAFVPHLLASCAGRRTVGEVQMLNRLRQTPEHPYVAIASGAKISTKVGMLRDLLSNVDTLCIGGAIANVFLAAQGKYPHHIYNADDVAVAKSLLDTHGQKIIVPTDIVVGSEDGNAATVVSADAIPENAECLGDIGPATVAAFVAACQSAKTILWNGPMGKFEVVAFAHGTMKLATELSKLPAFRVVGGGDTMKAIEQQRLTSKFDHVSIGGGALIEYMEGKVMPGLEPLYGEQAI